MHDEIRDHAAAGCCFGISFLFSLTFGFATGIDAGIREQWSDDDFLFLMEILSWASRISLPFVFSTNGGVEVLKFEVIALKRILFYCK